MTPDEIRLTILRQEIHEHARRIRTADGIQSAARLIGWLKSLQLLCAKATALGLEEVRPEDQIDLARLPTWGSRGCPDPQGLGLWSWDDEHMIIGNSVEDMRLVGRR